MRSKKRGIDGLLWTWANYRNFSRYFVLQMDGDGFLQLDLKGHNRPKAVEYRAKRLDDGQWHRVEMAKRGKELSLRVCNEGRIRVTQRNGPWEYGTEPNTFGIS